MKLKVKKNYPDAKLPERAKPTDSGLDVFVHNFIKRYKKDGEIEKGSNDLDYIFLEPGERILIDTGISVTFGVGYEIQVRPRSGLALKEGITVLNTPGTIDESYRGLLGIILINHANESFQIKKEDKIAQIVVAPVVLCEVEEVKELSETERGEGGFGSTGKK